MRNCCFLGGQGSESEHLLFPDLVRFALLSLTLSLRSLSNLQTPTSEFLPLEKVQESVKLQYSKKASAFSGRSLCPGELVMACFLVQPYSSFFAVTAQRLREDRASSVTFAAACSAVLTAEPGPRQARNRYVLVLRVPWTRKHTKVYGLRLPAIKMDITTCKKFIRALTLGLPECQKP